MDKKIFGFSLSSWILSSKITKEFSNYIKQKSFSYLFVLNKNIDILDFLKKLDSVPNWYLDKIKRSPSKLSNILSVPSSLCPIWIIKPDSNALDHSIKDLDSSNFLDSKISTLYKEYLGRFLSSFNQNFTDTLVVSFIDMNNDDIISSLIGMELSSYRFKKKFHSYLKDKDKDKDKNTDKEKLPSLIFTDLDKNLVVKAHRISASINLARHLSNLPANYIDPSSFSKIASLLFSKKTSDLSIEIWDNSRLKKENMNLILSVAQGSKKPANLIHIKYRYKKSNKFVSFIGKGVCFDSGGLDIKTASGMLDMKKDMSGAATVLATAFFVSQEKPKVNCDFYIPLVENSVSDTATHPRDIFVSKSGLSVEVNNTDAEGRLILADALYLATSSIKEKDKNNFMIVDIATLTGANRMALGPSIMGMYTSDDDLSRLFKIASYNSGDPVWHMPIYNGYASSIKSECADLTNISKDLSGGGAITATLFLKSFTNDLRYVHFDMYANADKPAGAIQEKGANGQGVELLIRFLLDL